MNVKPSQATEILTTFIKAKLVPLLRGSPGIGKSNIIHQIADVYGLKVIDLRLAQCDPTDLTGLPHFVNGRSSYLPMDTFPIEGDPIPKGFNGWLLFLDELTSASPAIQAASYKLILDRMVGQQKLHPNVAIVAAGNLETDNAIVENMSTALQSRMVHLTLEVDTNEWCDWAMTNGIDHRITDFIKFKPNQLYNFDPNHTDVTYACPRTWEFANRILDTDLSGHSYTAALAGILGEGVAREFIGYCKIYQTLPKPHEIIANPTSVRVPDEPSVLFAISGSVANNMNTDNADAYMKFINRLPKEFQVVTLKEARKRNENIVRHSAIRDWILNSSVELF